MLGIHYASQVLYIASKENRSAEPVDFSLLPYDASHHAFAPK